jgi:hypothetical protein
VKLTLVSFCLVVCSALAIGQTQNGASAAGTTTKDPVTAGLRLLLPRSQNNTVGAVEAMPADKYSYKPTADQITFAHLAAHIANSNNLLCSKAADVPAPKVEVKDTDGKDKLVAAVKDSFSFCSDALGKMDDSKLGDNLDIFGNGRQLPRAVAALSLAGGWADHYAAAAMYLRLNGILPPSAQKK